uniref:hypothetical protein n=1 Tax=Mesomycoplasma ovipneumoniae TaxID=29562 RepID=UPI00311983A0
MKSFEEVKEEVLKRGKEHHACQSGYAKAFRATNKIELLNAITANWSWCLVTTRMIDATFLEENFTEAELSEAGIYTRGTHEAGSMKIFACGIST